MQNTTKHDISTVPTVLHPAVRPVLSPRLALPTKQAIQDIETKKEAMRLPQPTRQSTSPPAKPMKRHRDRRHTAYIVTCQLLYGSIAIMLAIIAYFYLASYSAYLVVSIVVIVILWSNIASTTARKKTVDMLETIEHPALKVWRQRRNKALQNEKTDVFLKAIKASFLGKDHEIH